MLSFLSGLVLCATIAGLIKPKWRLWLKEATKMRYTVVSTTMFLGLVVLNGIFGLPVNNEGNELTQEVQPGSELSVNQDGSAEIQIRPGGQIEVSATEYGDDWAFTVESGTLDCIDNNSGVNIAAVIRAPQVGIVALNGVAQSVEGVLSTETIWKDDPNMPGLKVNIGPFIDLANQLCED